MLPAELAGRVRFDVADASKLPFQDGAFDLVVLLNMIPFFEELARVTAPGGTAVFAAVSGPEHADLDAARDPPRPSRAARVR